MARHEDYETRIASHAGRRCVGKKIDMLLQFSLPLGIWKLGSVNTPVKLLLILFCTFT